MTGTKRKRKPAADVAQVETTEPKQRGRKPTEPDALLYSRKVAQRVRAVRISCNYTVDELAEHLAKQVAKANAGKLSAARGALAGLLPPDARSIAVRLRHYESGRRTIPLDLLPLLADAFGGQPGGLLPE